MFFNKLENQMIKKFFSAIIIIAVLITFSACSNKDDKTKAKEDSTKTTQQTQTQATDKNEANKPVEATESDNPQANIKMLKTRLNSILLSELISRGVEIFFDYRTKSFDISQLIPYAPDPSKIWVYANAFNAWELVDFAIKGAKLIIFKNSKPFTAYSSFTVNALINEAKNPANIYISGKGYTSDDILNFLQNGATVIVGNTFEPFHILSFIKVGKERVIIYVKNFSSNWILNFVERGGSIRIDNSYNAFDVLTFAKAGKDRVSIWANGFDYKYIKMFLKAGAKVIMGRTSNNRFVHKSYDLVDIIKVNPANVTIIGDYYEQSEINKFIDLGANIVFYNIINYSNYDDITAYYDKIDSINTINIGRKKR